MIVIKSGMKVRLTFKDPDYSFDKDMSKKDLKYFEDNFTEWGEHITIEFDTKTKECEVIKR